MTARVSMLLKSRASPDMLPFSLYNKKRLAIRHMNRPLFTTTLSFQSYDMGKEVGLRTYHLPPSYLPAVKFGEFGAGINFMVECKISSYFPMLVHSLYRMLSSGELIPDSRIRTIHVQLPYTCNLVRGNSWFYSVVPSAEIVP